MGESEGTTLEKQSTKPANLCAVTKSSYFINVT
jgi:hypothetical protein